MVARTWGSAQTERAGPADAEAGGAALAPPPSLGSSGVAVAGVALGPSGDLDDLLLDSYSRTVCSVAEQLLPSVAALRVEDQLRRPKGAGSAVLISADGLLVTSAHVVHGSTRGTAAFTTGDEAPFEVVGADGLSDLAVLRVAGSGYQPARLGDASRLRVGQLVVAIGNPLGFEGSVSAGVVSALGRSLMASAGPGNRLLGDVIQTDAASTRGTREVLLPTVPQRSSGSIPLSSGRWSARVSGWRCLSIRRPSQSLAVSLRAAVSGGPTWALAVDHACSHSLSQ